MATFITLSVKYYYIISKFYFTISVMNAKYSFFVFVLLVCQVLMVSTACTRPALVIPFYD